MMAAVVQFFLIDHVVATGAVVGSMCVGLKAWMLYHCPSHPLYRGPERRDDRT